MKIYTVTIPMAGHIVQEVEAENEKDAIRIAAETASIDDIDSWEALDRFNKGNVCYCPQPWEIEVEEHGEVE